MIDINALVSSYQDAIKALLAACGPQEYHDLDRECEYQVAGTEHKEVNEMLIRLAVGGLLGSGEIVREMEYDCSTYTYDINYEKEN